MENQDLNYNLRMDLLDVIEKYGGRLLPSEVCQEMIRMATNLALSNYVDKLTAIRRILLCIEMEIANYQN